METVTDDGKSGPVQWRYNGGQRPDFALPTGPGQESVWGYPRPPEVVPETRRVEVFADGVRLAHTGRAFRVLETASPPTFYIPASDVRRQLLIPETGQSVCEWKGIASYWSLVMGNVTVRKVAWAYIQPRDAFAAIAGYLAFYPARLECRLDGERVTPQPGGFYGGWATSGIVGPFKGAPGTEWW
jgi:uncharacterized protein (DUF427 family)